MKILDWILKARERAASGRPFFVGVSAPQGAGKTTLTHKICEEGRALGLNIVAVSIDDFYLTRIDQLALANEHSQSPYLKHRGYPLTHDVALGNQTLSALREVSQPKHTLKIPRYNKSAFGGKGDRFPVDEWNEISGPVDIVLFEGWMLGFQQVANDKLPNKFFEPINAGLAQYRSWMDVVDAFIWLEPNKLTDIISWRIEAEEKTKAQGKVGMSKDEVRAYIESFLPAYETYLPTLRKFFDSDSGIPKLHLKIGSDRTIE